MIVLEDMRFIARPEVHEASVLIVEERSEDERRTKSFEALRSDSNMTEARALIDMSQGACTCARASVLHGASA
jgi:hypothetical protein